VDFSGRRRKHTEVSDADAREHIEALARALVPDAWDDDSDGLKSDLRRAALRAMGGRVFAAIASDPAAQDAVLAALVEGGALHCGCGWCCTGTPREQRGQGHAGCAP